MYCGCESDSGIASHQRVQDTCSEQAREFTLVDGTPLSSQQLAMSKREHQLSTDNRNELCIGVSYAKLLKPTGRAQRKCTPKHKLLGQRGQPNRRQQQRS